MELTEATEQVLVEHGIGGLTLERVAEAAGSSRVTLWRQGVTRETLIDDLLKRVAEDFVETMWPVMTSTSPPALRLQMALDALWAVADRHLPLLAISDEVFHWAADSAVAISGAPIGFLDPFVVVLRAGRSDGSLRVPGDVVDAADVLFNTACWSYVHMRYRHNWTRKRAREALGALITKGLAVER